MVERNSSSDAVNKDTRPPTIGLLKRAFQWFHGEASPTDWIIAIATIVIALSALAQVGVAVLQWREMRGAGGQTDRIIAADTRLVTANERLADAMERSVGVADSSLKQTQQAFRDDERAWLAPINGNVTIDEIHPLRVDVIYQNVGKTPALNVHTSLEWRNVPGNSPTTIKYDASQKNGEAGTLYPNGKNTVVAKAEAIPSKEALAAIRSGKMIYYFFGSITYKDVYGREHWSHFCEISLADMSALQACKNYNDAN